MKTRHRIAIVGLLASLGLVAASCVPETAEPEDTDLDPVSEGAEGEADEQMSEPGAAPEVAAVCLPIGAQCFGDHQCCSGECFQGICRYGGAGCLPIGAQCFGDHQCCSGECFQGICRHGGAGGCLPIGAYCQGDFQCCSGECFQGICRHEGSGGCLPVGAYCQGDFQCCSGECFKGICRAW